MMNQFKLCQAIYAGYTLYYIRVLDENGYIIGEHTIRSESNNISLWQV